MARNDLDVFTKLPDALLSIIISFLPFKEAARTSILSKRWLHIWHTTKNIDLDETSFIKSSESEENKDIQRRVFAIFIQDWIDNYQESTINQFRFKFSDPEKFRLHIETCIEFAIARDVKILRLDFSDPTWNEDEDEDHIAKFDLPVKVYKHGILESLELFSCDFQVREFNHFGSLKHLSLGWIELSIESIKQLLLDCKMLESLSLKKCWNINHLEIGGRELRLRSLVIEKCNFSQDWINIEAPNLRYFKYCGKVGMFDLQMNICMEEADLDFGIQTDYDDQFSNLLYKLLDDLYSVKVLTVCSYMLQVIPNGDEPIGMQEPLNVKHLRLKTAMHPFEYYGIKFFLKSCPFLHTLTLNIGPARIYSDYEPPFKSHMKPETFWSENIVVYKCVANTLEVVDVTGFTGETNEFCFMYYLLYFGRSLKQLNVSISNNGDSEHKKLYRERAERLKNYKRASENLIISIFLE